MAPQGQGVAWNEVLCCACCSKKFSEHLHATNLACGHAVCNMCVEHNMDEHWCRLDQITGKLPLDELPPNRALMSVCGVDVPVGLEGYVDMTDTLGPQDRFTLQAIDDCLCGLASYLRRAESERGGGVWSEVLSRTVQRKVITLICLQLAEEPCRIRAVRTARLTCERIVQELLVSAQNSASVSAQLWTAVRARGCQFLGPGMQEDVLNLILLTMSNSALIARKTLVMYVVQRLSEQYPHASKTSVGHVVQLLYRASCFNVLKRDGESSLMQLKEEFSTYEPLRKEHDMQIISIAMEAGLRIPPEQWSALLYGDNTFRNKMQSIIDKLQTPQSFGTAIEDLRKVSAGRPMQLEVASCVSVMERLTAGFMEEPDSSVSWEYLAEVMHALNDAVSKYAELAAKRIDDHDTRIKKESRDFDDRRERRARDAAADRSGASAVSAPTTNGCGGGANMSSFLYKTRMCRDVAAGGTCPRGGRCTYAHDLGELRDLPNMTAAPANYGAGAGVRPRFSPPLQSVAAHQQAQLMQQMHQQQQQHQQARNGYGSAPDASGQPSAPAPIAAPYPLRQAQVRVPALILAPPSFYNPGMMAPPQQANFQPAAGPMVMVPAAVAAAPGLPVADANGMIPSAPMVIPVWQGQSTVAAPQTAQHTPPQVTWLPSVVDYPHPPPQQHHQLHEQQLHEQQHQAMYWGAATSKMGGGSNSSKATYGTSSSSSIAARGSEMSEAEMLTIRREEIISRLQPLSLDADDGVGGGSSACGGALLFENDDAHVAYTVASSVLDDRISDLMQANAASATAIIELPPMPPGYTPVINSTTTSEETLGVISELALGDAAGAASSASVKARTSSLTNTTTTVRTACPPYAFISTEGCTTATVQADSSTMKLMDTISEPVATPMIVPSSSTVVYHHTAVPSSVGMVGGVVGAAVVAPPLSYDATPEAIARDAARLPMVIQPLSSINPTEDPQDIVSNALDRMMDVRKQAEVDGGHSTVEKAQLEVEREIASRQIDQMDPLWKQNCLLRELEAVEKKMEMIGVIPTSTC